jgi:hypothetical protein
MIINSSQIRLQFALRQTLYFAGMPGANQVVAQFINSPIGTQQSLLGPSQGNFSYCGAIANTLASNNTVFSILARSSLAGSDSQVGTLSFFTGVAVGNWAFTGSGNFYINPGTVISIMAPSSPDATIGNLSFLLQLLEI